MCWSKKWWRYCSWKMKLCIQSRRGEWDTHSEKYKVFHVAGAGPLGKSNGFRRRVRLVPGKQGAWSHMKEFELMLTAMGNEWIQFIDFEKGFVQSQFWTSNSWKHTGNRSSGQDGGVGRDPLLPHTTKRRTTTYLKSINNQKHQPIKLHGTPTTKELKKKSTRTTRPVRWWDQDGWLRKTTVTCRHWGQGWLPSSPDCAGGANLRGLRADCGLWLGVPQ